MSRLNPLRPALLAFVVYLALAALATAPLALHATDHVIGHVTDEATPPLNIWAMATVLHRLATSPLELFQGNAFYPHDHTLAFSEHLFVPALMAAPVVLLTDNWVLAYNVVTLVTLALAGLGTWLLARELGAGPVGALAAGCLYAFNTWNINELVRLQIASNAWFPYVLLALLLYFQRPSKTRAGAAGLFYLLQSLSCMYWGFYLAFFVGIAGLFLWWRYPIEWRRLVPLAATLGLALAITGVFVLPYSASAHEHGFRRDPPIPLSVERYVQVPENNLLYGGFLDSARWDQNAAHFLGFGSMALALVGLATTGRPRRTNAVTWFLAAVALGAFILSLGSPIRFGQTDVMPGPYSLLYHFVPGFQNIRYPERISIFVVLGLAPVVGLGLSRIRERLGAVPGGLLAAFVLVEHLAVPQFLDHIPSGSQVPAVYRWLGDQTDVHVVAEVPLRGIYWLERFEADLMYLSIFHWKRIPQGYTSYFPPIHNYVRWRLHRFPDPASVSFLERFGVDTVVVAPGASWPLDAANPRWTLVASFEDGYRVLRLDQAHDGVAFEPPAPAHVGLRELSRGQWHVRASSANEEAAIDGDPDTTWATKTRQEVGEYFRIRLEDIETVSRVTIEITPPYEFPVGLKLRGRPTAEDHWEEIDYDEAGAYDRLFASLLHDPAHARLELDFEPQALHSIRLQITEPDSFGMPWTMSEVRVFAPVSP